MSADDERRLMQDKTVKCLDPLTMEKNVKEQLKSDKIDDCQKSPLRFARFSFTLREKIYHFAVFWLTLSRFLCL